MKKKTTKSKKKQVLLDGIQKDLSDGSFFRGAIVRPTILTVSFLAFVASLFLVIAGDLRWGGSLVVFSFVLTLYSIYESLTDELSVFRNLNLIFKIALFVAEIVVFNWVLALVIY